MTNVIVTRFAVSFLLNDELKVDLLPAVNLTDRRLKLNSEEKVENQSENVLRVISGLPEAKRCFYSSSLSESQVSFMNNQSASVHVVVKLAKFWYRAISTNPGVKVPGLKYLIELVAVYCAQEEEKDSHKYHRNDSVLKALINIFTKLSDTKQLAIAFENGYGVAKCKAIKIANRRNGFVLDPQNPFNNVMSTVKDMCETRPELANAIFKLEEYSENTLPKLLALERTKRTQEIGYGWLEVVFKPTAFDDIGFNQPYRFAICFTYFDDWEEYLDETKLIIRPKSIEGDIDLIESVFKISLSTELFKNVFDDDDPHFIPNYYSDEDILEKMEGLQDGLIEYMENHVDVQHSKQLQQVFFPWGAQSHGPSVRAYNDGHCSLVAKLNNLRKKYYNVAVFHAPCWKGECAVENKQEDVLYCCCLIICA